MHLIASNRLKFIWLVLGILLLAIPSFLGAQEDSADIPLGDVARNLRKTITPINGVIDNDNLPQVVDEAESRRLAAPSPAFALDSGGTNFRVSSPDVSCSLSFNAKNSSQQSDAILVDDLPRSELAKLDGPAAIDGDSLQISVHNGTQWELREVVIGLTIVRRPEPGEAAYYQGQARIVPTAATTSLPQDSLQKQPDVTLLLHVKGSALPAATAIFRTSLNFALFPDQDWHWAIVKAKGIRPQSPPPEVTATQASPVTGQLLPSPPASASSSFPSVHASVNSVAAPR